MKKTRKNTVILAKNISKSYLLRTERPTAIEKIFSKKKTNRRFALKNININIKQGERVGVIGNNGSGKTTLLKILAGITQPTSGKVLVRGKVVSIIDITAGFHLDLNGIENIFLNGLIIGLRKQEINQRLDKIIKFIDIGDYINAPLYTYSAGMILRVGFSVAIFSNPDILLIDESFAVGDEIFRKKAIQKFEEFAEQQKTLVVVSHWPGFIKKNCNRVIHLKKGKIVHDGGLDLLDLYFTMPQC